MAGDSRLSARFGADTTDFKSGISAINRELRLVESEFRATASTMGDWANDATGLEARMEALNKQIDLQKEKVDALRVKHEQMATANGANSVEAQNAQIEFNKEAEKLGKLQTELGQTEYSLKGLKDESGKTRGVFQNLGTQFDKLKQQVPALGTAITLLTNPISLAVAGLGAFAVASRKSINETVEYNKQVREMMQLTGLSAEETSRLIQVGDDWGLELGTMRSAMELMNKKGITPSINNLAKIADEYVNATDKSAFMEAATKKYGKSFGDLIPILAKGGDALRKQTDSVDKNMIATDKSIEISREWEVAMDDLKDIIKGLGYVLGNDLLPPLLEAIKWIGKLVTTNLDAVDAADILRRAHKNGIITDKELAIALKSLRTGTDEYKTVLYKATAAEEEAKQKQEELNAESDKLDHIRATLTTTTDAAADAEAALAKATEEAAYQEKLAQAAADRLNQKYDDLNSAINGRLGPEMENFNKTQGELNKKMGEIQGEIDQAIKDGYDPLSEKVLGLKGNYDELKGQYDENADAHDEATKRILFDILEQRLSLGGLTEDEEKLLERQALDWGLVDQATLDVMDRYDEAGKYLATHKGDWVNAEKIINGQETAWSLAQTAARNAKLAVDDYSIALNNLDGKTVNTEIITTFTQHGKPGEAINKASGFEGFVKKPTLFMVGEAGPEYVNITPINRFGNLVATIEQLMIQSIKGLNAPTSPAVPGGDKFGNQMQPAAAPITIYIQGTPEKEMEKRRQARYVAEEIQRRQS
jgi:predicted  nucleic acid-binding Zn-ribbon protein